MKANHHGTANCNSETLLKKLSPQAVVIHTWRDIQPNPETIASISAVNSNYQVFTTNITEANKPRFSADKSKARPCSNTRKAGREQLFNLYVR